LIPLSLTLLMGQTAADQLRQIIVPDLMQLVGDVKVQRVSVDAVLTYLRRQQLLFDEQLLHDMFAEADFKHEGSLATGPLTGALQGRYARDLALSFAFATGLKIYLHLPHPIDFRNGSTGRLTGLLWFL